MFSNKAQLKKKLLKCLVMISIFVGFLSCVPELQKHISSYTTSLKICSQRSGILKEWNVLDWLLHIVDDSLPLSSFVQQDWATTGYPDESSKCKDQEIKEE